MGFIYWKMLSAFFFIIFCSYYNKYFVNFVIGCLFIGRSYTVCTYQLKESKINKNKYCFTYQLPWKYKKNFTNLLPWEYKQ